MTTFTLDEGSFSLFFALIVSFPEIFNFKHFCGLAFVETIFPFVFSSVTYGFFVVKHYAAFFSVYRGTLFLALVGNQSQTL